MEGPSKERAYLEPPTPGLDQPPASPLAQGGQHTQRAERAESGAGQSPNTANARSLWFRKPNLERLSHIQIDARPQGPHLSDVDDDDDVELGGGGGGGADTGDTKQRKMICGCSQSSFIILVFLIIVIIAAAIGGGVGGSLFASKR